MGVLPLPGGQLGLHRVFSASLGYRVSETLFQILKRKKQKKSRFLVFQMTLNFPHTSEGQDCRAVTAHLAWILQSRSHRGFPLPCGSVWLCLPGLGCVPALVHGVSCLPAVGSTDQ